MKKQLPLTFSRHLPTTLLIAGAKYKHTLYKQE